MNPPGYKYLGPFNRMNKGLPTNNLDWNAYNHDNGYAKIGSKSYWYFNQFDDDFIKRVKPEDGFWGHFAKGVFTLKKYIAPHMSRLPSNAMVNYQSRRSQARPRKRARTMATHGYLVRRSRGPVRRFLFNYGAGHRVAYPVRKIYRARRRTYRRYY